MSTDEGRSDYADRLAAALRRIDAVTYNRGHALRPIVSFDDQEVCRRANESDPTGHQRSLRCWDCDAANDKPVNPFHDPEGRTWGDDDHERFEAWVAARALLAERAGEGS